MDVFGMGDCRRFLLYPGRLLIHAHRLAALLIGIAAFRRHWLRRQVSKRDVQQRCLRPDRMPPTRESHQHATDHCALRNGGMTRGDHQANGSERRFFARCRKMSIGRSTVQRLRRLCLSANARAAIMERMERLPALDSLRAPPREANQADDAARSSNQPSSPPARAAVYGGFDAVNAPIPAVYGEGCFAPLIVASLVVPTIANADE